MIRYQNIAIPSRQQEHSGRKAQWGDPNADQEERAYIQDGHQDTHVKRLDRKRWRTDHRAANNHTSLEVTITVPIHTAWDSECKTAVGTASIQNAVKTIGAQPDISFQDVAFKPLLDILKDPASLPYHTDVINSRPPDLPAAGLDVRGIPSLR